MTGSYSVILTSVHGCTNMATVSASVIPSPVPVIQSVAGFCVGSSLVLNGSGGTSYSWFGPNGFNSTAQNPILVNAGFSAGGSYTLVVHSGSCYAKTYKSISAYALPTLTASSNGPVCVNTPVNFSAISASALTYSWTGPSSFSSNFQNPVINPAVPGSAGNYTVTGTDGNFCSATAYVSVATLAVPILSVSDVTTCIGSSVTFSASGASNYNWSGPQNFSSTLQTVYLPQVSSLNAGTYTVTATGTNSCSSSALMNLSGFAYPLPVPVIANIPKGCFNSVLQLKGSGGVSYLWEGPEKFRASAKDTGLALTNFLMTGTYSLTVKSESNCVATTTVFVRVYPLPQGNLISSRNNLCTPFCTKFSLQKVNNTDQYTNVTFGVDAINSRDTTRNYCFDIAGSYIASVHYSDTNNCANTTTLVVTANPKPEANFDFKPQNPVAGLEEVQFYNTTYGEGLGTWEWYLVKNDTSITRERNASYLYKSAGQFPIVLVVTNKWGCIDTAIKVLVVDDEFQMYVPNAFTPNGDGLNDVFMPKGQGVYKYTLEIYNRWGQVVFETNDFQRGWDGTFQGKPCKTETYVWRITVTTDQKENKKYTGQVAIVRGALKEEE
ncbi:hypothetical protein CNR22_06500 [Sphingobacteriaceae bacterium]|nr:hypothetical protein CNR22_06500 [Sphingobacteriaceae bacterium]